MRTAMLILAAQPALPRRGVAFSNGHRTAGCSSARSRIGLRVVAQARGSGDRGGSAGGASRTPPPDESDVLDLSAFLAGLGDEQDGSDGDSDSEEVNTWIYNTDDDKIVKGPPRKVSSFRAPSMDATPVPKRKLAQAPEETFTDKDWEVDEDEESDDDSDWAGLEADGEGASIITQSQKVDGRNLDESIEYLSTIKVEDLDPASRALLVEELGRKKKEQEAKQKKVQDTSVEPPKGQRRTHKQLQIIAGSVQNYKLWSPEDMNTRPMMSAVKAAVFSMLTSMAHDSGTASAFFPSGGRWLDLFAGTGAVGIEALSRGMAAAHFVELDPWVISNCLHRNLEHTGFTSAGVVHTQRVEAYLAAAAAPGAPAFGAPFDYVSLCPPYDKVSYSELLALLEASPLVKRGTRIVVEYPKRETANMLERIGRLVKVRDRRYGRTLVAIFESDADKGGAAGATARSAAEAAGGDEAAAARTQSA